MLSPRLGGIFHFFGEVRDIYIKFNAKDAEVTAASTKYLITVVVQQNYPQFL